MLPAPAFPFLAEVASSGNSALSAQNPVFAYAVGAVIIGGLITVITVADRLDAMIQRRRRQPSVDVDLSGLRADIQTLNSSVAELKSAKEHHNGHRERIAALETKCAELKAQIERDAATQRSYIAKTHKDITDQIDAVKESMANNFQQMERGLGRVEGTLELIAQTKS
ncbi:MAG TPA: hypothetical protein VL357_05840 [Rariglobus sp.]|jgi:hypothetical protein|nr:hypothetical protein [Rariglobus sp.]